MREQLAAGDDPLEIKKANLRKSLSQHLPMQPGVYMQNVSWMGESKACKAVVIDA